MDNKSDMYDDQRFEMFTKESESKALLWACGFGLAFVFIILLPWVVGCATLIRWIIF